MNSSGEDKTEDPVERTQMRYAHDRSERVFLRYKREEMETARNLRDSLLNDVSNVWWYDDIQ